MKFNNYFKNLTFFLLILLGTAVFSGVPAQSIPAPRESRLLNGMKLLVWSDNKSSKAIVKLRIHSGSAFDPLGKEGVMQLLSDVLFPVESTREFFAEDLNGNFEIITNYDYIQINASGDADKILTILETLAPGITNPPVNKESTEKALAALRARVQELEKNPTYVADRAVAKRLLGNFPYGRPQLGSSETLAKIDFADLLLAEEKFFTADNATMVVSGNVNADSVLRAAKRFFGGWIKSDKKIPATFAQPEAPSAGSIKVEMPNLDKVYVTTAIDTVGRSDKDFWATQVLARIWQQKYCFNSESSRNGALSYEPHLLRGIYFIRKNETPSESLPIYSGPCALFGLAADGKAAPESFTPAEFDAAKRAALAEFQQSAQNASSLLDLWLDTETYKLASVKDELLKINALTAADVQRVGDKIRKQPNVTVSLVKASEQKQNN
ncbi:MAG TPA: pitrilysin family protein [Pyrinomonadaceae bacterium]|jgi:predicted Zn-dependent peptidase